MQFLSRLYTRIEKLLYSWITWKYMIDKYDMIWYDKFKFFLYDSLMTYNLLNYVQKMF